MRLCIFLIGTVLFAQPVAGLKWSTPQGWKPEAARPMRAATYSVPLSPGDNGPAECAVYFFGQGSGGGIQANIDRWKSQFQRAAGSPPTLRSQAHHPRPLRLHHRNLRRLHRYGRPHGPTGIRRPQYRLLGAIVEGPGGNIFIKFTGPSKTVEANRKPFDLLLASFQKQ